MVQAVVVFTDGRSNLGSDGGLPGPAGAGAREKVPVFTVAVGEARETIGITLADLQAPDRRPRPTSSSSRRRGRRGRAGRPEVDVRLGLYLPGRDPKKDAPDHEVTQKLRFEGGANPAARHRRVRRRPGEAAPRP
jgi:hypothetical protein